MFILPTYTPNVCIIHASLPASNHPHPPMPPPILHLLTIDRLMTYWCCHGQDVKLMRQKTQPYLPQTINNVAVVTDLRTRETVERVSFSLTRALWRCPGNGWHKSWTFTPGSRNSSSMATLHFMPLRSHFKLCGPSIQQTLVWKL